MWCVGGSWAGLSGWIGPLLECSDNGVGTELAGIHSTPVTWQDLIEYNFREVYLLKKEVLTQKHLVSLHYFQLLPLPSGLSRATANGHSI